MCGILFAFKEKQIEKEIFERALGLLAHRGPDDQGSELFCNIGIGSTRLAIQDLSPKGHMPMSDSSGRYWIVFNGEVYNFKELKEQLKECYFKSGNDTEVVLYSYIKWGRGCLSRFRGMFAFVIYDSREKKAFFARDRFGQKPLLYYYNKKELIIGSEVKSLLHLKPALREIDESEISNVLSYRYVPDNKTGFKYILSLPSASFAELVVGQELKVERYWDVTNIETNENLDLRLALDQLENLLFESVNYRLIADVPIGVFLSGGVDSSVITALASKQYRGRLKTFSVGYVKEDEETELDYARIVAQKYKTDHQEIIVDFEKLDIISEIESLFKVLDRPIADPAIFPSFLMAKEVSRQVKVVLNGDGGDEMLAGYGKTLDLVKISQYFQLPWPIRKLASVVGRGINPRLAFLTEGLSHSLEEAFLSRIGCFHQKVSSGYYIDKRSLLKQEYFNDSSRYLKEIFAKTEDIYKKAEYFDLFSYMPDDTLPKIDFATMGNGLEARSPFLDHKLAEHALSIPYKLKLKEGQSKFIIKRIAEKYLPAEIIYRKKQGFSVPFKRWFKNELNEYLKGVLLDKNSFTTNYLNLKVVEKMISQHEKGKDYSNHLWVLLTLNKWGEKHADR
jgi:asparagine synthase (glutamine-hydrolysing)